MGPQPPLVWPMNGHGNWDAGLTAPAPDVVVGQSLSDGQRLVDALATMHEAAARSDLRGPSSAGVFPIALFVEPLAVVVDANWLRGDIRHACQHQRRTVLVNAANEQFIRAFCARHVVNEVLEHSAEWAQAPPDPVPVEDFRTRLFEEYLRVLRVVPDDGVPAGWLSPAERNRLALLADRDADDVPSAALALALRALFVSNDGAALQAVYGDSWKLAEQRQWLELLKAGGDAGQLRRMLFSAGAGAQLVGHGAVMGARRLYELLGPISLIGGGAIIWAAVRWLRQPSTKPVWAAARRTADVFGEALSFMEARRRQLDAALPPPAEWELGAALADALVGRAMLQRLARDPDGQSSARELCEKLGFTVSCTETHVRGILRTAPCFHEVGRGCWQVGMAMRRAPTPSQEPA